MQAGNRLNRMDIDSPDNRVFDRALDLVQFLRARCDWDARQTPESLIPYLLEEAHEVADAVAQADHAGLRTELGDLLLNVAFQTIIAEECARFTRADVVAALEDKMRRRHPHLYGGGPAPSWETLKSQERSAAAGTVATSILAGLARGLDPLSRAQRIQDRVSAVGFDWADTGGAFGKVEEELAEVRQALDAGATDEIEAELGDLLFAVVNLTRLAGGHALRALQRANAKFSTRFERLEELARMRGLELGDATLEQLDELWDEIKRAERGSFQG
jgi:nucleoside triphosphate diphosphatase